METRKRRAANKTPAQWAEVLAEYRGSGLTQDAYARLRGVSVAALRNHLYRRSVGERSSSPARSRGFVPVRLRSEAMRGDAMLTSKPTLVMRWPQGACLELHVEPSAPGVAELLGALLESCSP